MPRDYSTHNEDDQVWQNAMGFTQQWFITQYYAQNYYDERMWAPCLRKCESWFMQIRPLIKRKYNQKEREKTINNLEKQISTLRKEIHTTFKHGTTQQKAHLIAEHQEKLRTNFYELINELRQISHDLELVFEKGLNPEEAILYG